MACWLICNTHLLHSCYRQWCCCYTGISDGNRKAILPVSNTGYPQPLLHGGISDFNTIVNTIHTITWLILANYRGHGATPCLKYLNSGSAKWGYVFFLQRLLLPLSVKCPSHPLVTHRKGFRAIFNSSLSLNPTLRHSSNPVHFIW